MKRLYTTFILLVLTISFASAQVITERCFHLDKIQFIQQKQDFWRSHELFSTASRPGTLFTGGYYNLIEGQYGFGLGDLGPAYAHHYAGVTMINGWHFAGGLAMGAGVGYLHYNGGYAVPLYGDLRLFLGKQRVKFFLMGDGGFLLDFNDFPDYTRFFGNPGAGLIIPLARSLHLSFGAGLMTQWVIKKDTDVHRRDSFVNMKLGLLFGK